MRGFVLAVLVSMLLVGQASAQWICPTTKWDNQTELIPTSNRAKPAVGVAFNDSAYSTCYKRITDFTTTNSGESAQRYNPVNEYSQLQAWNRNQSLVFLASRDILRSPSWTKLRRLVSAGTFPNDINFGAANLRWSPTNDSIMYFSWNFSIQAGQTWKKRPAFMKVNVYTNAVDTVRVFPEYPGGLSIDTEHEDLSRDGKYVVLQGFTYQSGNTALQGSKGDSSEVFVLNVLANPGNPPTTRGVKGPGRKGRSNTGCGNVDDMMMSPDGRYALIHWGAYNATPAPDPGLGCGVDCGLASYDTLMNYVGAVMKGAGHFDTTIDDQGRAFAVAAMTGADCYSGGGTPSASIWKWRIPNGFDRYTAAGNFQTDTTGQALCLWPDQIGGLHISGRGLGSGFVVLSADLDPGATNHPNFHSVAFSQEIVKVYMDSKVATPHLERLANHRSDGWYVFKDRCSRDGSLDPSQTHSYYWAQPHATVSRDGTRIMWGSTWSLSASDTMGCIPAEAYVMDISNKARNSTLVNLTPNTWTLLSPTSKKFDGTTETNGFPIMEYSRATFAPELGSIIVWGGGGDGAGSHMGNDVWMYNTNKNEWSQITAGDPLSNYPGSPTGGMTIGQDTYCNRGANYSWGVAGGVNPNCSAGGPNLDCNPISNYGFIGTANNTGGTNEAPWSSHNYSQKAWDSYNRRFIVWGPNFNVFPLTSCEFPNNQSLCYIQARGSYYYDPYLSTWKFVAENPDLKSQGGQSFFDPLRNRVIANGAQYWSRQSDLCPATWSLDVTTNTWSRVALNHANFAFGADMTYDRQNDRILTYGWQFGGGFNGNKIWSFNPSTLAWSNPTTPAPDPVNGAPPAAAPSVTYDAKDKAMFMYGWAGDNNTEVRMPLWKYDVVANAWTKVAAGGTDPFTAGTNTAFRDIDSSLLWDPTNNVIFMFRMRNAPGTGLIGGWSSNPAELWAYKPSSGDGAGSTGSGGGTPPQTSCTSN